MHKIVDAGKTCSFKKKTKKNHRAESTSIFSQEHHNYRDISHVIILLDSLILKLMIKIEPYNEVFSNKLQITKRLKIYSYNVSAFNDMSDKFSKIFLSATIYIYYILCV